MNLHEREYVKEPSDVGKASDVAELDKYDDQSDGKDVSCKDGKASDKAKDCLRN